MRRTYFGDDLREKAIGMAGVEAGGLAADVGAGTGFLSEGLLGHGLRVIAVDESAKMLEEARRRLGTNPRIEFRLGAAEKIPVKSDSVCYVFANMLLHHTEDPRVAVRELARITKAGGRVVVTDLEEHAFAFLRTEQKDRWLGFSKSAVEDWFRRAGLSDVRVASLDECCCASSESGEAARVGIFAAVGTKPTHKTIK